MIARSRHARVTALLAVLFLFTATMTTAGPVRAADRDNIAFGDQGQNGSFGANDIVRIDGTITFNNKCPKGGIDDWVYAATDVYIVEAGSVASGDLNDVGGGRPNTIVAGASFFTDEVIGVTSPTGKIKAGSYDVVYDTCQDGKYDAGVDTIFTNAITVTLPVVLPPASDAIYQMKGQAFVDYLSWLATRFAMEQFFKLANEAIKLQCEIGNAVGCAMKKLDYFDGVKKRFLALMLSEANHYLAIALDPPDPDFKHVTTVGAIDEALDRTDSAIGTAVSAALLPLATESAISDALLHAVERYQGAVAAGDGGWALEHAREARDLAGLLAGVGGATSSAIGEMRAAMAADPDLAQAISMGMTFSHRVWSTGFTADERRALLNEGRSTTDIAALETAVRGDGAITGTTLADVLGKLDDTLAAHAATASSAGATAGKWDGVVSTLEADPRITGAGPGASAGGPYTANENATLTLHGSAAGAIDAAAWDLDADGDFDDASGLGPTATFATAGVHLVGMRVTAGGRVSVAYAIVSVADSAHAPVLSNPSPAERSATVTVGQSRSFSVGASDPDGDPVSFAWTIDGAPASAADGSLAFTPALSDVGVHAVAVTASDGTASGGSTRRTWDVVVLAPDTDADGWTATTDCDETDTSIHPTADERLGNGVDDDCDAGTPDAPPGGLTGSMQSWGSNHNGTIGTGTSSPTIVDAPVAIPGYDNVVQVESASRTGYALLDTGEIRGWGYNGVGNLGIGNQQTTLTPVSPLAVGGGPGTLSGITQFSASAGTDAVVAARRTDGTVVSWGNNGQRQVGDGSTVNYRLYPVQVLSGAGGPPLSGVREVETGYFETYALMDDGTVKAWGVIRCDGGTNIRIEPYPIALGKLGGNVRQMGSGNQWTMFLKKDGTVLSCGAIPPVAGHPATSFEQVYTPTQVGDFGPGSGVIDIAAGLETGLVLKADGTVWAWGKNNNGELDVLGVPGGASVPAPVQVPLPPGPPVVDIDASGACHGLALRADGSVLGWGCDFFGQVGNGPDNSGGIVETAQVISMPGRSAVSISDSVWNSLALTRPVADTAWERPATWVDASVNDATVGEGSGGSFEVDLSAALPQDVTVHWTLEAGTAGAGDLGLESGTVTIPAGATSAQVPVPVHDDALDEDAETFTIVLSDASNGIGLARPQATGTIVDDDAPPSVSVEPASVAEGDTSLTDATVRIRLSGVTSKPVAVDFATTDGTATAPADYADASGRVIIPAGQDEAFVHLAVRGDTSVEPIERLTVSLSNPDNATMGDASAAVTITDDEPLMLVVTSPQVTEGSTGTTAATFTVALEPPAPNGTTVSVSYAVQGLSATVPDDVAAASGTLEFGPGDGPKQVTVDVAGDTLVEAVETFRLALGSPVVTGGRVVLPGDVPPAVIVDDDVSPPPPPVDQPPVVDAGPDASGAEGSAIPLDATASDPDAGDVLTYAWSSTAGGDVDAGATCAFAGAAAIDTTIRCTDDGTFTATLTVTDSQAHSVTDTVKVTVTNVAPGIEITTPAQSTTVVPGATVTVSAAITDPGTNDALTCQIDWGDGDNAAGTIANGTCGGGHAYASAGTPTIKVVASDDDTGSGSDEVVLTVAAEPTNPPVVDAGPDRSGAEGSAIALDATGSDPDAGDTLTYAWSSTAGGDVDDGASCTFAHPTAVDTTIRCTDDGTYTAKLTVTDSQGHPVTDTVKVTVTNAAPVVDITTPADFATVVVGATVTVSAAITDPGTNDAVTCQIDWGDGGKDAGTYANGTCGGSHAYGTPGVPTITVTASDDDTGSGSDSVTPTISDDATKVTGGGWIAPNGARVSFGFVAGPDGAGFKGQLEVNPSGHQFHAGIVTNLVTSGSTATWSGSGRWDGATGYTYLVTVVDNGNGAGGKPKPDTFSIEIRNTAGAVVLRTSGPLKAGNIKVG